MHSKVESTYVDTVLLSGIWYSMSEQTGLTMAWFEEMNGCIILSVRVVPRAAKDSLAGVMGGELLKIRI